MTVPLECRITIGQWDCPPLHICNKVLEGFGATYRDDHFLFQVVKRHEIWRLAYVTREIRVHELDVILFVLVVSTAIIRIAQILVRFEDCSAWVGQLLDYSVIVAEAAVVILNVKIVQAERAKMFAKSVSHAEHFLWTEAVSVVVFLFKNLDYRYVHMRI